MLDFSKVKQIETCMAHAADRGLFLDSPNDWAKRAEKEPSCPCFVYLYPYHADEAPGMHRVIYVVQGEQAIYSSVVEMLDRSEEDLQLCNIWME